MKADDLKIPNPPIVEAVFNIQTTGGCELTGEHTLGIKKLLESNYPDIQQVREAEITVSITDTEEDVQRNDTLIGFRGVSADKKQIAQFNQNGLTFNRLKPYDSCDSYLEETIRLWEMYQALTIPVSTTRIALRNINQMLFDSVYDVSELFTIHPERAQIKGLARDGFNLQAQFTDATSRARCNVVLVQREASKNEYFLDIETYIDVQESDAGSIIKHFKTLRCLKNRIFTGALSLKGLEVLKES